MNHECNPYLKRYDNIIVELLYVHFFFIKCVKILSKILSFHILTNLNNIRQNKKYNPFRLELIDKSPFFNNDKTEIFTMNFKNLDEKIHQADNNDPRGHLGDEGAIKDDLSEVKNAEVLGSKVCQFHQ